MRCLIIIGVLVLVHYVSICAAFAQVTFTDVTQEAGITSESLNSVAVAWGDYDNDGDLDLYVSRGSWEPGVPIEEPDVLYRNNEVMSSSIITALTPPGQPGAENVLVLNPDVVQEGDFGELLAIRFYSDTPLTSKFLVVAYREVASDDGFVMTAYLARRLSARRRTIWKR